jgi:actin-related protein
MSNNIVLSGGTTMIPGFQQRIKTTFMNSKEIEFSSLHNSQIIAEGNRNIATWIGASMIASMSSFEKMFIKKVDFMENGEERIPLFSRII